MKTLAVAVLGLMLAFGGNHVIAGTTIYSWSGAQAIPDNNANGVAFSFYLNTPTAELIDSVSVQLNIAGGWNGDLFSYISHGSGYAVLLNRIGRTGSNLDGSGVAGLNGTFSDAFAKDIHTYDGPVVNGNFAPDGRATSPYAVLDSDPRTATLSSFAGLSAGGFWTLYFADLSPLAVSTIQGWTVTINTSPVPEPGTGGLVGIALAVYILRRARR